MNRDLEVTNKEDAFQRLEELPKVLFSRLKGKILHDVEELIGEKILDEVGEHKKLANGRLAYKDTPELTLAKKVVTSRISKISMDVKTLLDKIIPILKGE